MQNLLPTKKKTKQNKKNKRETSSWCFHNWCQWNYLKTLSTNRRGTFRSTTHAKQECGMIGSLRLLWLPIYRTKVEAKRQPDSQSKPGNQMASKTKNHARNLEKKKRTVIESVLLRRTQQNRKSRSIEEKWRSAWGTMQLASSWCNSNIL